MELKGNLLHEIKPVSKATPYHCILTASLKWQNQSDGALVSGRHGSGLLGQHKDVSLCWNNSACCLWWDLQKSIYVIKFLKELSTKKQNKTSHKLVHAKSSENQERSIVYLPALYQRYFIGFDCVFYLCEITSLRKLSAGTQELCTLYHFLWV